MIRRLIGAATATAAVRAAMVTVSPAPAAPASSRPRACTSQGAAEQLHTTDTVHLRAGKGTRYRSLAVLAKNTDFYAECWDMSRPGVVGVRPADMPASLAGGGAG
ncbi:hypothetical protein ACFVY4_34455 [Streptomyces sp. NPDC058299]|uniref:hypothetical protein n=1 Tax=Streptomyces sp. NPDC058299 TaxID=3346435 RepID=UPI0036EBCA58